MKTAPSISDIPDFSKLNRLRVSLLHRLIKTSRSMVWLDDTHVYLVTRAALTESYCQLSLTDILGTTIMHTRSGRLGNIGLSVLAFVALLSGASSIEQGSYGGLVGGGIVAATIMLLILLNTALGPTCRCYLRTAVQNAPVAAVTRQSTARQLADELSALIRVAQVETLAALDAQAAASGASVTAPSEHVTVDETPAT